jgi:hypothetical protein
MVTFGSTNATVGSTNATVGSTNATVGAWTGVNILFGLQ